MTTKPAPSNKTLRRLDRLKMRHGDFDHTVCYGSPGQPDGVGRCPRRIFDEGEELVAGWQKEADDLNGANPLNWPRLVYLLGKVSNRVAEESACLPGLELPWAARRITHTDSAGNPDHPAYTWATSCAETHAWDQSISGPALLAVTAASVKGADPVARSVRRQALSPFLTSLTLPAGGAITQPPAATEEDTKPANYWWLLVPAALILLTVAR